MPTESETAYPRFKSTVTDRELREVYTPTPDEYELARQHTTGTIAQLAFLILLKTFQRLGHAVSLTAVPVRVVDHIANQVGLTVTTADLIGYDASGTRRRHLRIIRTYLGISAYGPEAQAAMEQAMAEAALGKDDLTDLINIALEEMVRQHWELPAFSAFSRAATKVRSRVNNGFHAHIGPSRNFHTKATNIPDNYARIWNDKEQREDRGGISPFRVDTGGQTLSGKSTLHFLIRDSAQTDSSITEYNWGESSQVSVYRRKWRENR